MKSILKILIPLFLLVSPAQARHSVEVGVGTFYSLYTEPNFMKDEGIMFSTNASYEYKNKFLLRAEGKYSQGEVDYESERGDSLDGIKNTQLDSRLKVGLDNNPSIYSGFGYRYFLGSPDKKTSKGYQVFDREVTYYYLPIGISGEISSIDFGFEYDHLIIGKVENHIKGNKFTNTQTKGHGIKMEVGLTKKLKELKVRFGLYLQDWMIKDSNNVNGFYEPENNKIERGGNVSIGF